MRTLPPLSANTPHQSSWRDRRSMQCNSFGLYSPVLPYCVVPRYLVSDTRVSLIMHFPPSHSSILLTLLTELFYFPHHLFTSPVSKQVSTLVCSCLRCSFYTLPTGSSRHLLRTVSTHPSLAFSFFVGLSVVCNSTVAPTCVVILCD